MIQTNQEVKTECDANLDNAKQTTKNFDFQNFLYFFFFLFFFSPIHDHGSSTCWMKVLEGEIIEKEFCPENKGLDLLNTIVLNEGTVQHKDSSIIHSLENMSKREAVTLHVYSPPCVESFVWDLEGNKKETHPQFNNCTKVAY
jgi:hypothetical protein